MKKTGIKIKNFNLKDGKLVKSLKQYNVSLRLKKQASKAVRVVPRGKT